MTANEIKLIADNATLNNDTLYGRIENMIKSRAHLKELVEWIYEKIDDELKQRLQNEGFFVSRNLHTGDEENEYLAYCYEISWV